MLGSARLWGCSPPVRLVRFVHAVLGGFRSSRTTLRSAILDSSQSNSMYIAAPRTCPCGTAPLWHGGCGRGGRGGLLGRHASACPPPVWGGPLGPAVVRVCVACFWASPHKCPTGRHSVVESLCAGGAASGAAIPSPAAAGAAITPLSLSGGGWHMDSEVRRQAGCYTLPGSPAGVPCAPAHVGARQLVCVASILPTLPRPPVKAGYSLR